MPARLPPYASLRLGMIDLEARPCPPGPTEPATQTAPDVGARQSQKRHFACLKASATLTPVGVKKAVHPMCSAPDSRSALRARVAANPPGSNPGL